MRLPSSLLLFLFPHHCPAASPHRRCLLPYPTSNTAGCWSCPSPRHRCGCYLSPMPPSSLLAAAVGGTVMVAAIAPSLSRPVVVVIVVAVPSLSSIFPLPIHPILVVPRVYPASRRSWRRSQVRWWHLVILSRSSFCCRCLSSHPPSTLRAVASKGGGDGCARSKQSPHCIPFE